MIRRKIFISITLSVFFIATSFANSDLITIPFRTIGKMIIVQGRINGQLGNIVIDTGLPDMLINQRFFNLNRYSAKPSPGLLSLNGDHRNTKNIVVILSINDFSVKTGADVIDLQAIEKQKRTNILGIVGIELFRRYELEIDYHAEEIRLYRLDRDGQRKWQQPEAMPSEILSFDYYQHLPCITTYLDGMPLQLGLDTGAEKTLLARSVYERRKGQFHEVRPQRVIDLHGQSAEAIAARIDGLEVGGLEISAIPAVFIPLGTHYGSLNGKNIQGLLGHDFLRHFRLAINFKKKKVYLWTERQSENMPLVIRER